MNTDDTPAIGKLSPLFHPLFSNISRPPQSVWIEGRPSALSLLERLPDWGFSVVGTRSPERRASYLTQETIRRLRGTPIIVISGMARGIDSVAHEAALSVGLPTIAVLGCGISRTYPPENLRLRKRIIESGGLIISEFEPDLEAYPGCFIQRNRIIAGMAKATWIVQSGFRSGALNTAHSAMKQGRTLFVTPSFPGDPSFLGNENLLAREGPAIPLYSAEALSSCWIDLFSTVEKNRKSPAGPHEANLISEIEAGMKDGKALLSIIEDRSRRTGESVDELIKKLETGMLT